MPSASVWGRLHEGRAVLTWSWPVPENMSLAATDKRTHGLVITLTEQPVVAFQQRLHWAGLLTAYIPRNQSGLLRLAAEAHKAFAAQKLCALLMRLHAQASRQISAVLFMSNACAPQCMCAMWHQKHTGDLARCCNQPSEHKSGNYTGGCASSKYKSPPGYHLSSR